MDSLLVANRHNYVHKISSQNPLRCPDEVPGDTWNNFVSLGWFYGYLSKRCNTTTELLSKAFKDYWLQHASSAIPKEDLYSSAANELLLASPPTRVRFS